MTKLRVLVVEDSLTVRKRLCEIVASDPTLELVGEAADGKRATELCAQLRPDVISLDMMLPVMSGLAATEHIMAYAPTPILIVSASTERAELFQTYDALAAGAIDVLEKPRADEIDGVWERKFIATLKLIARIKVITHPRARLASLGRALSPPAEPLPAGAPRSYGVIAIGASTGGPAALVEVLRALPAPLSAPVLIVLHIDERFSALFAEWLDRQTTHCVRYARGGESLASLGACVIMAPPERHLIVAGGRLQLSADPPRHSCRPSVDVLFESLARELGSGVLAVLLTGMGRDGASGLLDIRRAGGATIAQDEASSVVYGMPREAALIGAAEQVLPLAQIGRTIERLCAEGRRVP